MKLVSSIVNIHHVLNQTNYKRFMYEDRTIHNEDHRKPKSI
jgi:hypothetical protein